MTMVISGFQEPNVPGGGVDVWTIPLDGRPADQLTRDGSGEGYPCWSPDGRWIAFTDRVETSEDEGFRAIYLIPSGGGEVRQLTSEADSLDGGAIAYSPNGGGIAFFSDGTIKTKPLDGGRPEVIVTSVRSNSQSDLAWSPDGDKIAFSGGGEIWVASVGGEPEELRTGLPEGTRLGTFDWSPDGEKIVFVAVMGGEPEFWLVSDFLPRESVR
jgi:Tol biopolymer transport system component